MPSTGPPRNACAEQRQDLLNPGYTGFAKTFTGSFLTGPTDRIGGPFEEPKTRPMKTALGSAIDDWKFKVAGTGAIAVSGDSSKQGE